MTHYPVYATCFTKRGHTLKHTVYIDNNTDVYKTVHKRFHDLAHEVNTPRFVISFNSAEHFSLRSLSVHHLPLSAGGGGIEPPTTKFSKRGGA